MHIFFSAHWSGVVKISSALLSLSDLSRQEGALAQWKPRIPRNLIPRILCDIALVLWDFILVFNSQNLVDFVSNIIVQFVGSRYMASLVLNSNVCLNSAPLRNVRCYDAPAAFDVSRPHTFPSSPRVIFLKILIASSMDKGETTIKFQVCLLGLRYFVLRCLHASILRTQTHRADEV